MCMSLHLLDIVGQTRDLFCATEIVPFVHTSTCFERGTPPIHQGQEEVLCVLLVNGCL